MGNNGTRLHRFARFVTDDTAISTQVNTLPNSGDSVRSVSFSSTQAHNTADTLNTAIDSFASDNGGANWHRTGEPGFDSVIVSRYFLRLWGETPVCPVLGS